MSHSLAKLLYHCIFATKERRPLLRGLLAEKIDGYLAGIARNHNAHLIRSGGTDDHRHLLLELRPNVSVCDILRIIKANSSKWMHETWPELHGIGWQTGYAAFTVSYSVRQKVIDYINQQRDHHHAMTFDEELRHMLDLHQVAYDSSLTAE